METWQIWGRKTNGNVIRCFKWRGDAKNGIAAARREAQEWDYGLDECWAEKELSVLEAIIANGRVVVVRG